MKRLICILLLLQLIFCIAKDIYHNKLRILEEFTCGTNQIFDKEVNKCVCIEGYYGDDCDKFCPGLHFSEDDDEVYECSGFGTCDPGTLKCKCNSYAFGEDCSYVCDFYADGNEVIICGNKGLCTFDEEKQDAICECDPGYYGSGCEYSCPGTVYDNSTSTLIECSSNGKCTHFDEDYYCQCNEGFFGLSCENECPGMIEADGKRVPCNNHGTCNEQGKCMCDKGYYGDECTQSCPGLTTDSEGNTLECSGHGSCDPETLQCKCKENRYVGEDCQCDDEITCSGKGKCNSHGICICDKYSGEFCSIACDYLTMCSGHGVCNEDLTCNCVSTYYGEHCENQCEDLVNCSGNGMCLHNGKCLCKDGFHGANCDGAVSLEMDINLLVILLLMVVLTVQLYCFYKQTKKPRFAEKLKPTQPKKAPTVEMTQVTAPTPIVGGWTCSACTMVNAATATRCSVCSTPKTKPTISKPKRVRRAGKTLPVKKEEEVKEMVKEMVKAPEEKKEEVDALFDDEEEVVINRSARKSRRNQKKEEKEESRESAVQVPKNPSTSEQGELSKPTEQAEPSKSAPEPAQPTQSAQSTPEPAQSTQSTPEPAQPAPGESDEPDKPAQTVDHLLEITSHDGEGEVMANEQMRITVMKKKLDAKRVNVLIRFYAVNEALKEIKHTISTPKYITVEQNDLSATQCDKEECAYQQCIFVLNAEKPLKLKIEGSYKAGDNEITFNTGGLSLE